MARTASQSGRRGVAALGGLILGAALLVSCSEEAAKEISESALRNAVASASEAALEDKGYRIDGNLSCTADVTDGDPPTFTVSCTGKTTDGDPVKVDAKGKQENGKETGSYQATVAGKTVLQDECFGDC